MGLDMYAYVGQPGQHDEHYSAEGEYVDGEWRTKSGPSRPREIAYWRKHPNLHGWMERLWERKMAAEGRDNPHRFNGIELELTWEDIDELERAVTHQQLPATSGFFFGEPSDDYYQEQDLEFIKNARAELFLGLRVFYNSSW